MRKFLFIPVAALGVALACGESTRDPVAPATPSTPMGPAGRLNDNIVNNLDQSIDAVAEVMPLNIGTNGTTQLYVDPTNGDGKSGCNLTGGSTLTVSITSSNPAVATVSPSSATFNSCGATPTLTVTPVSQGTATISIAQTGNTTGATFTFGPATFTVNVSAPPPSNTAPTISVAGVTGGASYDKGSVPAATCQVTDAEDGSQSFAATLSSITGTYATDGIGSQTASCSYTDKGGLVASASLTYGIVDPSAPSVSYVLAPSAPDGSNGWYKSDVTLTWTVTESESPNSLTKTGCVDQSITADQVETTYSCAATSAGGSATNVDVKIKRDGAAPTVAYTSASGTVGSNGWYTSDVTATFTATDLISGFGGSSTQTGTATSSGEGAAVGVSSPVFTDDAGNAATAGTATQNFKIDKTAPTNLAFVGGPTDGGTYYFGTVPAAPTCTADDAVSGVAACNVSGHGTAVGAYTLTATATDNAGNTASATRSYTVNAWTLKGFYQPVDGGGVYNTVKAGSTVPFKFNIFAGSTELTDVASVKSFSYVAIGCSATAPLDDVEVTTTGGTSLRYDATGRQFVQNWQTPKALGCYRVTMTTQDGSSLVALFKLK